jgi:hypothetical protein
LMTTATAPEPNSWLALLRPASPVHIVVVTDDDPGWRTSSSFLKHITQAAGGELGTVKAPQFQVHGLLGMGVRGAESVVYDAEKPIVTVKCAVQPGVEYQRAAIQTGGLRGSLCSPAGIQAFGAALVARIGSATRQRCHATLPEGWTADQVTRCTPSCPTARATR